MQKNISSLITFKNSQGTEARGTLLKLSRTTIVFEVYNPYSIVQLSEVLQDLSIRRQDEMIYQGKAVVSNLVNTGLMLIVSATLVDTWSDLTEILKSKRAIKEEIEDFISYWKEYHKLRPGYQLAVGEIRSFLGNLSRWLEQLDLIDEKETTNESGFFDALEPPLEPQLGELLKNFEEEAKNVPSVALDAHKTFAQQDLHPLIMNSPFTHRIFNKPLGYAGDHEMVNMIWENKYDGPTTYAKLINKLHLNFEAAEAHRNRINILTERLGQCCDVTYKEERPAKILNVGCGPALEIFQFLHTYPHVEYADFTLMDFNEQTLGITENRLSTALREKSQRPNIQYRLQSVYTLLKQTANKLPSIGKEEEFDFVYCAGLFDYLADRACAKLLNIFYQWVKPGGLVLATNVHPQNNGMYWMEHILEWHLIYRDEKHMENLIPHIGKQNVYADETGVNVFLEIRK